jgi:hypothetical protein
MYKSGMVGPHASGTDKNNEREDKNNQVICCSHCKSETDRRRTSKLCAMNPKKLAAKEKVCETKLRQGKCDTSTV